MSSTRKGQKKVCSVWLEPEVGYRGDDKKKMFFCFNCRIPLIQYRVDVMTVVPGDTPYTPATELKCKGSVRSKVGDWENCGMYYIFFPAYYTKHPEMV